MASDAVSQLRDDTQKAMEAHLEAIEAEQNQVENDPQRREHRRSAIMQRIGKAYALGKDELIRAVAKALRRDAERERGLLFRDRQGFSAYRFAKKVASIRSVGGQIADLEFQGEERLRELYIRLVLKLGRVA